MEEAVRQVSELAAISDKGPGKKEKSELAAPENTAREVNPDEMGFRQQVLQAFPHDPVDIRTYSPLALAFLGDAVFSLMIRTIVISKGNRQAAKMHDESKRLVSAKRQCAIGKAIQDLLTEEEAKVYKRGRNANPYHHAKNASLPEYHEATAVEVLCAYLYLQDRNERFLELLRAGIERTGGLI